MRQESENCVKAVWKKPSAKTLEISKTLGGVLVNQSEDFVTQTTDGADLRGAS